MEDLKSNPRMSKDSERLTALKQEQSKYHTRAFYMMIEIAFIFGVPAGLAVFVGKYLDARLGEERFWVLVCLAFAFVFSWAVVIFRYLKLERKMRAIDDEIKREKEKSRKTF